LDKNLHTLWETSSYPFNQITIHLGHEYIDITDLLLCLQKVSLFLKKYFTDSKIYLNHDWHEHDGFINNSMVIKWNDYEKSLLDTQSLFDSRDGDDYVRITIYPENIGFILRYYISEEDDVNIGICGTFDLTIDKIYLNDISKLIESTGMQYFISYSKDYFDKNYSG